MRYNIKHMGFLKGLFKKEEAKSNSLVNVKSPSGSLVFEFSLKNGSPSYRVLKNQEVLLSNSRLGFEIYNEKPIAENLGVVRILPKFKDETWQSVVGETLDIVNKYNETTFYLAEREKDGRIFTLRVRVFDEGVAFRYEFPPQPGFQRMIITNELTEFNLDIHAKSWSMPAFTLARSETDYEERSIFNLTGSRQTPFTAELPSGKILSIHEAALINYGSMTLGLNKIGRLEANITPLSDGMKAYLTLPFETPWRVVMVADTAVQLTKNKMILSLNQSPRMNFDWVEPIKFLGIWWAMLIGVWSFTASERQGATTEHALEYLDWCEKLGISGLLIEGWSDKNFAKKLDKQKILASAKQKNIEIVAQCETASRIDDYEKNMVKQFDELEAQGVRYLKLDYSGPKMLIKGREEFHQSQAGVLHFSNVLKLAAQKKMMLNVHESIKGTGLERTYPNLLCTEGAKGQEYEGGGLNSKHAVILPFTRMLAGGFDFTPGIFDLNNPAKKVYSTLARQLAYYVVFHSGMQMLADRPESYEKNRDALSFIQKVPVNFEIEVPLLGKIGEYYAVARRGRGETDWYIGGIVDDMARTMKIKLSFLEKDVKYNAFIFRDGDIADFRTNPTDLKIERLVVDAEDELEIPVVGMGGFAVRLMKA